MSTFNIAVLPGDYIGPEITAEPRGERMVEGPQEKMQREVWDTEQYNEYEIARFVRDGFKLAQQRRKHLTLIAKSNVMKSGLFWREVSDGVAKEFPDVTMDYMHV